MRELDIEAMPSAEPEDEAKSAELAAWAQDYEPTYLAKVARSELWRMELASPWPA